MPVRRDFCERGSSVAGCRGNGVTAPFPFCVIGWLFPTRKATRVACSRAVNSAGCEARLRKAELLRYSALHAIEHRLCADHCAGRVPTLLGRPRKRSRHAATAGGGVISISVRQDRKSVVWGKRV